MKPPKLNKLSKKELRREYKRQWREAIRANGEIYKGNETNKELQKIAMEAERRRKIAEENMEGMEQEIKTRIEEKGKILEGIRKISNWNVTGFDHIKEGELILIMQSYFDEKMKEKEELEREKRLITEAKNNITNWDIVDLWGGVQYTLVEREKYREMVNKTNRAIFMEGDNVRMKEDIEDWKEAVSRSRNLMNSYKELAERKNTEKNSIEKMAGMTFQIVSNEILNFMKENDLVEKSGEIYFMEKGKARTEYQELSEELKDQFRVMATRIVSEDPDKE